MLTAKSRLVAAGLVAAIMAAAYAIGHLHGRHRAELAHAAERLEAERQVANALATLASAVAAADAKAAEQRAKAQSLARQVTRSRDATLATLPSADCSVPDDRRLLIGATYCARFPAHPGCMHGGLQPISD